MFSFDIIKNVDTYCIFICKIYHFLEEIVFKNIIFWEDTIRNIEREINFEKIVLT